MANGTIIELDDEECTQEKPPDEEPCESETPCQASDWIATEWSGCEDTCGKCGNLMNLFDFFGLKLIKIVKYYFRAIEAIFRMNHSRTKKMCRALHSIIYLPIKFNEKENLVLLLDISCRVE